MTLLEKARAIVLEAYADGEWHSAWAHNDLRRLRGVGWARSYDLMDKLVAEGTLERRRALGANFGRGGNEYRLAAVPVSVTADQESAGNGDEQ